MTAAEHAIRRNLIVQAWGTPHASFGSVNEPRERTENGVTFNEKWTYRLPRHRGERACQRLVYWMRYDFVASFVVDVEGGVAREDPRTLLAGLSDREYLPEA